MTRDDIDELMRNNGIVVVGEAVYALCQLVAAAEREECAQFFDDNDTNLFWGSQAASHIRARGEA
jgi:hypothetical protein